MTWDPRVVVDVDVQCATGKESMITLVFQRHDNGVTSISAQSFVASTDVVERLLRGLRRPPGDTIALPEGK